MSKKVKVSIDNILVVKDGDPTGKGEIYWYFSADNVKIDERSVNTPRKTASGENIPIGKAVTLEKKKGQTLSLYGTVADKDSGFDGADEVGSFSRSFQKSDNWGAGPIIENINDGPLSVTVFGRVDVI